MVMTTTQTTRKPCREGHIDCIGVNSPTDECKNVKTCKRHEWMDGRDSAGFITQTCGRCGKERA